MLLQLTAVFAQFGTIEGTIYFAGDSTFIFSVKISHSVAGIKITGTSILKAGSIF